MRYLNNQAVTFFIGNEGEDYSYDQIQHQSTA